MTQQKQHDPDVLSRILMLTFGRMDHGGPYWCYVAIKPSRYNDFRRVMSSMQYNIQNFPNDGFGEVICSGEGDRPPTKITKQVAAMFNVPISELFKDEHPDETLRRKFEALQQEANPQ